MDADPVTVEHVGGGHTVRWMIPPPLMGQRYRVRREEWNDERTERTIYEIELIPPT